MKIRFFDNAGFLGKTTFEPRFSANSEVKPLSGEIGEGSSHRHLKGRSDKLHYRESYGRVCISGIVSATFLSDISS